MLSRQTGGAASTSTHDSAGSATPQFVVHTHELEPQPQLQQRQPQYGQRILQPQHDTNHPMVIAFNVTVTMSKTARLGIGLRELAGGVVVVHTFKRVDNLPGISEEAGLRLGDILLGVNSRAFVGGLESVAGVLKEEQEKGDVITMQVGNRDQLHPSNPRFRLHHH